MKKINVISYVVGVLCFLIAGYIIYDKFTSNDTLTINFNEDEEIELLNDELSQIGSSLGWLIIVDGIDNQDDDGSYNLSFNNNLLDNYANKQLFVMEYILSYNNYDKFVVLSAFDNSLTDGVPTDDYTLAYLDYDSFNDYYKSLFEEDFNMAKAMKGNTSYDENYVYYDNRRAGSNGVYVSMMQATTADYEDGVYSSNVTVTYSTKASELVGASIDKAIIKYSKDINDNIILKSFTLQNR